MVYAFYAFLYVRTHAKELEASSLAGFREWAIGSSQEAGWATLDLPADGAAPAGGHQEVQATWPSPTPQDRQADLRSEA